MNHVAMQYALTFEPLAGDGPGYAFPCDAQGVVDLDALEERERNEYFFARALVGHTLNAPTVRPCSGE